MMPLFALSIERLTLTGRYQASDDIQDLAPCAPIELTGFDVPGHEVSNVVFREITIANDTPGIRLRHTKHVTLTHIDCR